MLILLKKLRIDASHRLVETLSTFIDAVGIQVGGVSFGRPSRPPGSHSL